MNIRMVTPEGKVIEETPETSQAIASSAATTISQEGEIDKTALSQVLGLENDSERSQYKDQLQTVLKWAKQEGYKNPDDLKWMIRSLQTKLGTPPLTERWITRVARYAFLDMETQKMKEEQVGLMR